MAHAKCAFVCSYRNISRQDINLIKLMELLLFCPRHDCFNRYDYRVSFYHLLFVFCQPSELLRNRRNATWHPSRMTISWLRHSATPLIRWTPWFIACSELTESGAMQTEIKINTNSCSTTASFSLSMCFQRMQSIRCKHPSPTHINHNLVCDGILFDRSYLVVWCVDSN